MEHNLIMNKFKFQLLNQYGVRYKIQQLTPQPHRFTVHLGI